MQEILSQRLREARTRLGLTQAEAAKLIGISQPMLHRAETSLSISSNRLLQILEYFVIQRKINADWLLGKPVDSMDKLPAQEKKTDLDQQKLELLAAFRRQLDELGDSNP